MNMLRHTTRQVRQSFFFYHQNSAPFTFPPPLRCRAGLPYTLHKIKVGGLTMYCMGVMQRGPSNGGDRPPFRTFPPTDGNYVRSRVSHCDGRHSLLLLICLNTTPDGGSTSWKHSSFGARFSLPIQCSISLSVLGKWSNSMSFPVHFVPF